MKKKSNLWTGSFLSCIYYVCFASSLWGLAIPESYTVRLDGLEIPRKTVDETYDFIIQDLEYCIANLPTRSQWGSGSYYKASKGAAQALLGDVYLTRGCMDNNNTVYFQEAKKQLGM